MEVLMGMYIDKTKVIPFNGTLVEAKYRSQTGPFGDPGHKKTYAKE